MANNIELLFAIDPGLFLYIPEALIRFRIARSEAMFMITEAYIVAHNSLNMSIVYKHIYVGVCVWVVSLRF